MSSWAKGMMARSIAPAAVMVFALASSAGLAQTSVAPPAPAAKQAAPKAMPASTAGRFGFGRPAKPEEIAAWDVDVRPDGHGLRPGRGTVAQGQDVYDAQCASCHGTFGESNNYMAIAGGVEPGDLKTGRASRLKDPEVPRTLGMKLNAATTLYDYIYRAMPWPNPMSLTVDQTYAVTAYVLHLNEIVPADFELSDKNITKVLMPNRNGFTRDHGMGSVKGKPDVQGGLCMTNCPSETKVVSELPEHARNAHGVLVEQFRQIGPKGAIDTSRYERVRAAPVATTGPVGDAGKPAALNPRDIASRNACLACHGVDQKLVGPSLREIGSKYAARGDADAYVAGKIKSGGTGVWGQVPMPAQPNVKDDEALALARWILGGAK
ncbi:MAG: c-type cytochrome [Burkholderiales bacterium]|nr:c-type cytochrome [Burkholderiales bacterium]